MTRWTWPVGSSRVFPVVLVVLSAALVLAAPVSGQDYLDLLGANLEVASDFLSDASDAMRDCNIQLIDCFRAPDDTISRVEASRAGLAGIITNLSSLDPPAEHAESHARLLQGFEKVRSGLDLYNQALLDRNPDGLTVAVEVIQDGRDDIEAATQAILETGGPSPDLLTVLTVVVVAASAALAVLFVFLMRRLRRENLDEMQRNLATCPKCGEVLDRWWTFPKNQIREWQAAHLKSHEREEAESAPSKDGG